MIRPLALAALLLAPPAFALTPKPIKQIPKTPASAPAPIGDAAAFAEAEAALKRFEALRMPEAKGLTMQAWSTQLQKSMQALATQMANLQQRYARVAGSASPTYAVPALVRLGEVMEKFAADVERMPIHPELPADSIKQLRASLHTAAEGMRVSARGSYGTAVQRAEATGFTGEWVDFARAAMRRLPEAVKPAGR